MLGSVSEMAEAELVGVVGVVAAEGVLVGAVLGGSCSRGEAACRVVRMVGMPACSMVLRGCCPCV